jgi:hypothetical protein
MIITDTDARMVADRLGLTSEDADECRAALLDIDAEGLDAFLERTLRESATAVQAAYDGELPTTAIVRRAQVRQRIAEAMTAMIAIRQLLENHPGTVH